MNDQLRLLNVPTEEPVRYKINFIRTAVCELRFPVLLELEEKPPIKFQSVLRKDYPNYSPEQGVAIGEGKATSLGSRFLFESKKKDWLITLKPNSIALETTKYTEFDDFFNRLEKLLITVGGLLDTDFFTRVGLRYINSVPLNDHAIEGWINPSLIAPLQDGMLGTISAFHSEIRGHIEGGQYTFRHGIEPSTVQNNALTSYMLDYDYSTIDTEYDEVLSRVEQFNKQNFSFFRWALDYKAKELLGEGEARK